MSGVACATLADSRHWTSSGFTIELEKLEVPSAGQGDPSGPSRQRWIVRSLSRWHAPRD